jgi:uncharacterized membrane protein HdeD (DUF308 family)
MATADEWLRPSAGLVGRIRARWWWTMAAVTAAVALGGVVLGMDPATAGWLLVAAAGCVLVAAGTSRRDRALDHALDDEPG